MEGFLFNKDVVYTKLKEKFDLALEEWIHFVGRCVSAEVQELEALFSYKL